MIREDRGRPAGNQAASESLDINTTTVQPAALTRFEHDLLVDAFLIGRRQFWLRRAQDFENAKPRVENPADHPPEALERLRRRWLWCDEIVRACKARAEMAEFDEEVRSLFADLGFAA